MVKNQTIKGLELVCTCSSCPEQYDVYLDNQEVGYIRVRWGAIRVDYPTCGGRVVYYNENIKGDGALTVEEREAELTKAAKAILKAHQVGKEDEQATQ